MHPKYQEVIKLRKLGKSYREIAKSVSISKNSVSRWCKDLKLPQKAINIIEEKNKNNKEFFAFYNKQRHELVQSENKRIIENASKEINSLSARELMIIGAALYWAEGYKKQEHISSPCVRFVNSDPLIDLLLNKDLCYNLQFWLQNHKNSSACLKGKPPYFSVFSLKIASFRL